MEDDAWNDFLKDLQGTLTTYVIEAIGRVMYKTISDEQMDEIMSNKRPSYAMVAYLKRDGIIRPGDVSVLYEISKKNARSGIATVEQACERYMKNPAYRNTISSNKTTSFVAQTQNSTILSPPESLRDALKHPDYIPIFAKVFLKLNGINPQTNLTGWQLLKNQFLTIEFPQSLLNSLFSGTSKNPSEDLVIYIANNTTININKFCEMIGSEQIGLAKYAKKLQATYEKCNEKFKNLISQTNSNRNEIYCWCNQKDISFLIPILEKQGFRTLEDIADITEDDLQKLGVELMGQRKAIMRAISTLKLPLK